MDLKEIGGYQVIEMVGEGGQGSVYRAQDASTGQIVAIKVLSRSASDGEFLDRFQREASIMATLRHPNVVEVYDHGEENGQHYIVTEFVTENLERILERGGTLPLQRAITVVQQIASALQISHNAGITHRDIKPANVLLNDAGDVKLTDFGIASAEQLDSMTSENTTVGTPLYMSPEQIQGSDAIDGRSDLYSLGCLLYEVLTGATPFPGKSTFEIFNGHINDAHVPIANHMDEFPEQLEDLLTKSLTKDRDQRYQTADEMINDLEEINTILAEGPQDVARTRVMPKVLATQVIDKPNTTGSSTTGGGGMPKWLMPAGAIVALLVIIGGGAFFFMGQDSGAVGLATGIAADISGENWAPGIIANPDGIQQAASDLSAAYGQDPVSAVAGINRLDDLDPMFAASVIMGIHSQNQSQAAQILFSIADADELRLEGHLARLTETDPIHAGEILVSLINENVTEVASLMEDVIEGDNGQILQAMFVEAAMNDDLAIAQLVNEAALTPGAEQSIAKALISIANADIEIAADILAGTNTGSSSIWQPFIAIEPTGAGATFIKAYKSGYEGEVTEKIINILPDIYVSSLLLSHMAREDSAETARVYAGLMDNQDAGPGSMSPTIVEAARFDYVAVEKMLTEDASFIGHLSQYAHPQIWTTMELPMAGDGEEGKGIWTKPSLDSSSLINFSSIVVKSLNASDIESGTVGIFDVTPPVSDTRQDRNVLTYVQIDTAGFISNGLTTILVFDVPRSHFVVNETGFAEGHPWSVELSRFNDSSQTWTPVFANTIDEDEEKITFAAPVAGLSQYGTSFWSVSTSRESVAGSQLSIDQIDTSPAGNGQVHVQATVTNRSPQAVSRDLSLIIDGIPEYSTTVEVDSQSVVIVATDIFMKPGMRNLSLGNHNTSYENLLVAGSIGDSGSTGDSGADGSVSGSDLASFGAECPSESEVPDNEVHYDSEIESTIDCAGDIDQWVFEGRTGDLVTIQMKAGPGSELDAAIDLVSPNDKLVKSDDDSSDASTPPANGIDSEITGYELRFNGMYSILSKGGGTGGYNLVVTTSDNSTPDAPAQPVLSSADDTGDSNSDRITKKDSGLSFYIERESNFGEKPHIRLWRGNDIEIGSCNADEYEGTCTVEVNELSEGEHLIYATAINQMGISSLKSESVHVTIDTEIETPSEPDLTADSDTGKETDDDLTSEDSPTFSGTGEPYARVEIIDSVDSVLGTDMVASTGIWKVTADEESLPDGTHLIFARVIDDAGNLSDLSAPIEITVDTEAPNRMSAPKPNQNGEISGNLEPELLITLYSNGEDVFSAETQSNGDYVLEMNSLPGGENALTVTATDAAGNESEMSNPQTVTWDRGPGQGQGQGPGQGTNEAPIIDAMFGNNPNNNTWEETRDTDDSFPEFRGWGEPFMDVTLRSNGNRIGENTVRADGSWIIYPDREMHEGNQFITAELVDPNTGRVGPLSDPFEIDIHPAGSGNVMIPTTPQMYWNDASGRQMSGTETAASHDVWFEGYADSGAYIVLMNDMEQIGDTYANQNGQWSIYPYQDLTPGYYYINAYSENDFGMQSGWSQTAEIYVTSAMADIKPPVIEGLLYYDSYGNTILTDSAVTGFVGFQGYNAAPDMELHVYANGEEIAHAQVYPDGAWEAWSNFMLKPGGYDLTAIALDWNSGMEVESEPFWVEITDVPRPTVYGVRDQWGDWTTVHDASLVGPMMLGGSAEPNMRIEVFVDGNKIADSGTDANMDTWEIGPTPEACFSQGTYKVTAYGYANGTMQSEESDPVWIDVIGDGKEMCDMMRNMMESGSSMMQGGMQGGTMGGSDMFGNNSGNMMGGNDM
ncbi:MAG: Ig-like domain-containing protein, partial [Dehalococcoidia bacterium]|nr:Ig-like domain-containing protein [Dehalococcoidia bacterium]